MTHDPIAVEWTSVPTQLDYLTEFAARVREDERQRCREAVAALPWTVTFTDLWHIDKADALAAIDALRSAPSTPADPHDVPPPPPHDGGCRCPQCLRDLAWRSNSDAASESNISTSEKP